MTTFISGLLIWLKVASKVGLAGTSRTSEQDDSARVDEALAEPDVVLFAEAQVLQPQGGLALSRTRMTVFSPHLVGKGG